MYIPFEAVTITPLKHNRKILSRFSLQNQMFCVCRLPAVIGIFAVEISINQNINGLVGKNNTHLTCSFIKDNNQNFINVAIIARNKNGIFPKTEPVAVFPPDKVALLPPAGDYLSGRVILTNITKVSTTATLRFVYLKCEDEKDYICIFSYVNDLSFVVIDESEPTRILIKAFPSIPDSISYVVIESIRIEKQNNSFANFTNNRKNIYRRTNPNNNHNIFTDTVTLTSLQSTEKSVSTFREGDIVQFTCTGNIGKPPGRFVWQIIPQQEELVVYSNETTMVVDQIPDICSYRGTSNLTVRMTADHFKAKIRCFEESQADIIGMFVETEPLNIIYTVRLIKITKQPNQEQYDQKTPTITLICNGDGNPEPTYKWFRQGNTRSILSSSNVYIIEDVIQNNSGVYICEAYNTIDDVEYIANYSVQIDIVDKLWSTELDSLKISAVHVVYVILVICAVVIGALVVRKYYYNPPKKKKRKQNCCQKLMDCSMKCNDDSNVKTIANSTIPLTKLESGSDDNKERENHSRSRNNEESGSQNLDDSFISCHGITFNSEYTPIIFINNTVKSGDLEDTFDVDNTIPENKINRSSNGEEKNLVTTVDINPILDATSESDSIYADPCDKIKLGHVSDETDIDINV